jgi:hypothetical protein
MPTPTATPRPPAPVIDYFKARCISGADCSDVENITSGSTPSDTMKYRVAAGKKVQVYWLTRNAAQVTLNGTSVTNNVDGQEISSNIGPLTQETKLYALKANNPGAQPEWSPPRSINFELFVDPPPPPSDVSGPDLSAGPITITWRYPENQLSKTTGFFRVYRYTVPDTTPENYFDVEAKAGTSTQQYVDTPTPTCGKQYYVVTLYLDLDGNTQESGTSTSSWYTVPCS